MASITEIPHKLSHYAALIAYLSLAPSVPAPSLASRLEAKVVPGLPPKPTEAGEGDSTLEEAKPVEEDVEMKEDEDRAVNIGRAIVQDLTKALQENLDERKWRSARYLVRFPLLREGKLQHGWLTPSHQRSRSSPRSPRSRPSRRLSSRPHRSSYSSHHSRPF